MKNIYEAADFFMLRHAMLPKQSAFERYKRDSVFQEAVLVASPELAKALETSALSDKTTQSLLKYFQRMTFRATPFGLFSAVGWGTFADKSSLSVSHETVQKALRPDMKWVQKVKELRHSDKAFVKGLKVMTNPFIVTERDRLTLVKFEEEKAKRRSYSIKATLFSKAVMQLAEKPIRYETLLTHLIKQFEAHEPEKIEQHLWQIFSQEFLLSELTPDLATTYTGEKLLSPELAQLFKTWSSKGLGEGIAELNSIYEMMSSVAEVEYPVSVDSCQTKESTLSRGIQETLARAATILMRLAPQKEPSSIDTYYTSFIEKYGTRRLVPFLELIDETTGLGLPKMSPPQEPIAENPLFSCMQQEELVIDDLVKEWDDLPNEKAQMVPLSMELFFELDAESEEAIDKGNYRLILNPTVASPQAACTFGRFFALWDATKVETMRDFLKKEEALIPYAAFVEASFLPDSARTSNVCFQAKVRNYQLPFHYHEANEQTLTLSDIYVGATQEKLYLFSKKLHKPLMVTLSTSVNPDLAPPFLKFILAISRAHFSPFSNFPWHAASNASYLPRIRYENVILCPRRWRFQIEESCERQLAKSKLLSWLEKQKVPQQIQLCHYDNRLFLDCQQESHLELLLQELLQKREITLFESLSSLHGYAQEFVVPLVKRSEHQLKESSYAYPRAETLPSALRHFLPGSHWLYLKIFTTQENEATFIQEELLPFAESQGGSWFYVRYAEERAHIRLRFYQPQEKLLQIIHNWAKWQIEQQKISDIEIASYERELERYGGPECIELAEEFFHADSQLCAKILHLPDLPFVCAFDIVQMIDHFFDTLDEQIAFLKPMEVDNALLAGQRAKLKTFGEFSHDLFSLTPLKQYVEKIDLLESQGKLWNTKKGILDSLIHMHCNRLLGIDSTLEKLARVTALYALKRKRGLAACK